VLFNQHLKAKGYIARGGQIVDATIVSAPVQHNGRSENEAIKAGKTPEGWQEKRQGCALDQEARPQLLRLQEPHCHRPHAQAHPPARGNGCERAREPEAR
jgi:hypothetical protein